jgi:Rieske Fe-S protein
MGHLPHVETERRGFFVRFFTGALSALLGLVPLGIGLGFFFDPLLRKRRGQADADSPSGAADDQRKDAEGFIRLDMPVSALPADGTPVAYKVHDDREDAWNRFTHVEVGTVWLRRTGDNQVTALSSICPHLGCAVDFRNARGDFFCPCHTSSFNLDGERTNLIPPRGMDRLEVRLKPETGDLIWLKYRSFRAGTPEMIPIS